MYDRKAQQAEINSEIMKQRLITKGKYWTFQNEIFQVAQITFF